MKYLTFIAVFGVLMVGTFSVSGYAHAACSEVYTDGDVPNSPFGAPFNVFSATKDLLVQAKACTDTSVVISAGSDSLQTSTWHEGYYWSASGWEKLSFISSQPKGWLTGSVAAVVPKQDDVTYIALYMCQTTSEGRKCGCRDASCSKENWMIQGVSTRSSGTSNTSSDEEDSNVRSTKSNDEKWLMGYYPSWDDERLSYDDIPWEMMTHLSFGIAAPRADGTLNTEFDKSGDEGETLAKRTVRAAHRNDVVALLMIGGDGATNWPSATSNKNVRKYAKNLIDAMDRMGFDGLDLDWEPLREEHIPQMKALATELRRLRPDMVLTMPLLHLNINWKKPSNEFGKMARLFDQINIMTYDMSGAWSGWQSWHHSALDGEDETKPTSIQSSIQGYISAGIPRSKLGIGVPFYGRCWEGVERPGEDVVQTKVKTHGAMSYRLIRREYFDEDNLEWDSRARSSYLSFDEPTGPDGCTFITYSEERDMTLRGNYVQDENLGGAIVWSLGQAHMDENSRKNRHPLLKALWEGMQ